MQKNKFSSSQITQPVWLPNVWKISSPINRTMWKKWTVIITNWKLLLSLFHWKYTSMHLYLRRVRFGVYVDMHKRRERKKCCICCCYSSFIHNHNRKNCTMLNHCVISREYNFENGIERIFHNFYSMRLFSCMNTHKMFGLTE